MDSKELNLCRQTVKRFLYACLKTRDLTEIRELLAEDVFCFGMVRKGDCKGREQALQLFAEEKELFRNGVESVSEWVECESIAPGIYYARASAEVVPRLGQAPEKVQLSALVAERGSGLQIWRMHLSVPEGVGELLRRAQEEKELRQMAQQELERLQCTDTLTGLLNAEGFSREARKMMQERPEQAHAFFKFGVDHFRIINRTYGYDTGDLLLKNIAKNLRGLCEEGEFCARVEKDLFILLLNHPSSQEELDARLDCILASLVDEELADSLGTGISFTGGVYLPEADGCEEVKDILDKALMARQSIKQQGYGNRYAYFNKHMYDRIIMDTGLLERAPMAMERGEFQVYIQPQVDIATGRPVAGEALVRWVPPDGEIIGPNRFIEAFEENGFIEKLDFYVLDRLCARMREWERQGFRAISIAVNQSRRHLQSETYLEDFCAVVDRYGVPHQSVVFELTERTFMEYDVQMFNLARKLHQLGFLLAIDDFGTGYTALNLLGMLSADILKVDRSLVADAVRLPRSEVVLRKVIEIAQETGMQVICEGIETEEQHRLLRRLGCDVGQGFYFYRPMPMRDFERLLPGYSREEEPAAIG